MNNIEIDLNLIMVVFAIIQLIMVGVFIGVIISLYSKLNKLLKEKQITNDKSNKQIDKHQ